jgi:hypothetical protein
MVRTMTPVTDPQLIAQLEGSNQPSPGMGTPVSDPALIAQLEGNQTSNPSLPFRLSGDIAGGIANAGQGLGNAFLHNIPAAVANAGQAIPHLLGMQGTNYDFNKLFGVNQQPNTNFAKTFGVNNPNFGDQLLQGAAKYASYGPLGDASIGSQIGVGGIYGLTQSQNPATGIVSGEAAGLAGGLGGKALGSTIGTLAGTKNTVNSIGNKVLDYLSNANAKGAALSPQEAADNLSTNYTGMGNQPVNVDIGTLANNPALKGVYQGLKYVPFTNISKNINLMNKQLSDKGISDIQTQLQNETQNPIVSSLNDQLNTMRTQQQPYNAAINAAPDYLNNLPGGLSNRANLTQELTDNTRTIYKANKAASAQDYAPINDSNIRLDKLGLDNVFQNYSSAAQDLLAKRENLTNLFGSDADLGSKLNTELDKAQGVLSNQQTYGMTLPEAVQRIQNLGRLSASATGQGNRYEGMLLGNLRDGLSSDVNNALMNSGNEDIASQLQTANTNFKNNVVPFWQNTEIRKSVTDPNYISPQTKLAKALHDPNNQTILSQLPNDSQNAALYQLITGGKGTSGGMANMGAADIAKSYAKLPVDTKTAVASYNPQADKYFEVLPQLLAKNNELDAHQNLLSKQLQTAGIIQQKNIGNLTSQLQKLKKQSYGIAKENSSLGENTAKGVEGAGALAAAHYLSPYAALGLPVTSLAGRTLAKSLNNPALVQAYINNSRLPVTTSLSSSLLNRLGSAFLTSQSLNQSGGQ